MTLAIFLLLTEFQRTQKRAGEEEEGETEPSKRELP